jgi:hypothetical protein
MATYRDTLQTYPEGYCHHIHVVICILNLPRGLMRIW